jgi:hypothetical protein
MLKYLIAGNLMGAAEHAAPRGWLAIGYAKYSTPQGDVVICPQRLTDLSPTRGEPLESIKGPSFAENREAERFEQLIKNDSAKWIKQ